MLPKAVPEVIMAPATAPGVAPTILDLKKKCESNPVGPDGKRVSGTVDSRNACLPAANLSGFDLRDVDLWGANLRGAQMESAEGLEARSISGADVTGAHLPPEIAEFKAMDVLADIAPSAAALFLALLGACLYCLITIGATKDKALILDSSTQSLPIMQTAIPLVGFYALAPPILVVLFLYLQLNLQRMWEALATLPAKFPDGRGIDERVYPWVYIQRIRAYYPWLQYTATARVENYLGSFLGYLAVPATIAFSCRRVAVMHSYWLTSWHLFLFTLAVLIGLLSWWSSRDALCGLPKRRQWKSIAQWPYAWRSGLAAISVLAMAWIALGPWRARAANLRGEDLSTKPSTWTAGSSDISQVTGASLVGAKLSGADMQNTFLVNANLSYADLSGAKLTRSDLRAANLTHADLSGATLEDANLQGATLKGANFGNTDTGAIRRVRQSANWLFVHYGQSELTSLGLPLQHDDQLEKNDFQHYQLYPSGEPVGVLNFHHGVLADANFTGVDLSSADFTDADLTGATLKDCKLDHAKFQNAILTHCDLSGAKLDHATGLTASQLKDVILCKDTSLPDRLKKLASAEPCLNLAANSAPSH
jgi:uncharacterized protein YjbI with pentapeptide repeats